MKFRLLAFFVITISELAATCLYAQESQATVYLYWPVKPGDKLTSNYDIKLNDQVVGQLAPKKIIKFNAKPGSSVLSVNTKNESTYKIILEEGKTYYFASVMGEGTSSDHMFFREANSKTAASEMSAFDRETAKHILMDSKLITTDTAVALGNLFHRKRVGGRIRAIVFAALALSATINTAETQAQYVTINPGTPNAQTVPISSDNSGYLGVVLFTVGSATGVFQAAHYSNENLNSLLSDLKNGWHVPPKIKKKFKEKDFQVVR